MFGHDPPMYLRPMTATRCPFSGKRPGSNSRARPSTEYHQIKFFGPRVLKCPDRRGLVRAFHEDPSYPKAGRRALFQLDEIAEWMEQRGLKLEQIS